MLNYGNYHGKCMIINTNSPRYNRQLYDYGVFSLFQFMRQMGMPECLVRTCEKLYNASSTSYITPHGLTPQIPVRRGTLQGDTLSPHLFTLFLEPLMRWIRCGSRGYVPQCTTGCEGEFTITYDEHGYADDISITTGSLVDLKMQLRKLHLFSKYTGMELEITKCEVTGALWDRGSPVSRENITALRNQIATIDLTGESGGPSMKFLPPNQSYKMLGVHINPLLDFSEHFRHITAEVRKLATVLKRRRLSPHRKQLVIDQLLQSKYHAVHLGIFTDAQLTNIYRPYPCIRLQERPPAHPRVRYRRHIQSHQAVRAGMSLYPH